MPSLMRTMAVLLAMLCAASWSCATTSGSGRDDDDDEEEKKDEGDEGGGRRRRKPARSRSKARVLIDAKRLPDAVVETTSGQGPREDVEQLRRNFCDGREDEPAIFYQLVVSTHWHYYWICSDKRPQRVMTPQGQTKLQSWVRRMQSQGSSESANCQSGSRKRLFRERHESGTVAQGYCDGRLVLKYPDGGQKALFFSSSAGQSGSDGEDGGDAPAPTPGPGGGTDCPPCKACPVPRCKDCPPCPPPKACPKLDCTAKERGSAEKGFWNGVDKACKRICKMIYKHCRSIDQKTAMCSTLETFCDERCAKR